MNQEIRRELISKNLGIKPINHGQIYTFQIALPDARKQPILLEKRQAIEKSFVAHQSNLMSLIVRRTDAYDDEDIEYELVHGAEWLQIAQELDVEKVWAWVFDMTDDQAIATIREMEQLTATSPASSSPQPAPDNSTTSANTPDLSALMDQKLQLAAESIKHALAITLNGIRDDLNEKLKVVNYRLDTLQSSNPDIPGLADVLEKLDVIQQRLPNRGGSLPPFDGVQINLLEANNSEIERVLTQVGTQSRQIKGAIVAVQYWKNSESGLTWHNLELSAKAKTGSPYKINGFAQGTCDRLRRVATLPTPDPS